MSGTKPKFLEGVNLQESYYAQPNPYVNIPSCNVNLLELSRYARQQKKKLSELTVEEVKKFLLE
jgi:hypothetical protein